MKTPRDQLGRWLLLLAVGPLVSLAWAGFVLMSPYAPSQLDPPPPRVAAFNSFADSAHVLSLGFVRSPAIRWGNALDQDLSSWIQRETFRLLPLHALGTTACALVALVVLAVRWPRRVRNLGGIILVVLTLSWGAVILTGVSPSGSWDIPCLVLAWASMSLGPICVLVLVSSGVRALGAARSGSPGG